MSNATLVSTTLAGTIAAVAESTITYPLEYMKTRRQMAARPLSVGTLPEFAIPHVKSVFFQGCSPFIVGNALKTMLRFSVFNSATKFMSDGSGQTNAPAVVVSGMITGIAETLLLVPFESIKVTMIEASSIGKGAAVGALAPLGAEGTHLVISGAEKHAATKSSSSSSALPKVAKVPPVQPQPSSKPISRGKVKTVRPAAAAPAAAPAAASRAPVSGEAALGLAKAQGGGSALNTTAIHAIHGPRGMLRTIRDMYQTRGLRAFVQGFNPTVTRQVTNSVLRFTGWNMWTQLVSLDGEERMSLYAVLFGSAATAAVEAVATQPIDVIKTRMQTANGKILYGNSLVCAYRVFTEEGRRQLWAGLTPRFIRKWIGGGIIWAVYEISSSSIDSAMREHPFK